MKTRYQILIIFLSIFSLAGLAAIGKLYFPQYYPNADRQKVLILPEEICQAEAGDHMELYTIGDTSYLSYTLAGKGQPQPMIIGDQYTVGEDIDYRQNNMVSVDSIKKIYNMVFEMDTTKKDTN